MIYTRVVDASVAGMRPEKLNWNQLVKSMVILAMKELRDFDAVSRICRCRVMKGEHKNRALLYIGEVDISHHGMNSNNACVTVVDFARLLGVELEITFIWQHKPTAKFPGETGLLRIAGRKELD